MGRAIRLPMKTTLALLMFVLSFSVFAQNLTPEEREQIETAPVLRCNVVKAPWYLYRAQANARKVVKCWTPGCVVRKTRKAEKNFCKAVNVCDTMAEVLNDPCTEDNRLTEAAKAEMKENMAKAIDVMADKALEIIKAIKDEILNRERNS